MMCDMCVPGVGDHDKPYRFGHIGDMRLRLTIGQIHCLAVLRRHVADVRGGYCHGPAWGDTSTDDPVCTGCGLPLHTHLKLEICQRGSN